MIKGPKNQDVMEELTSDDGQVRVVIRQWKDKVQVTSEYLGTKYNFSVLASDIKYVPDKVFNAEHWLMFYREVLPLVGKENFEKSIRKVGQEVYNQHRR